jgi:hypothetical protein
MYKYTVLLHAITFLSLGVRKGGSRTRNTADFRYVGTDHLNHILIDLTYLSTDLRVATGLKTPSGLTNFAL